MPVHARRRAPLASAVLAVVIAGACGSTRGNITASAGPTDDASTTPSTTTTSSPAPVPEGLVVVDPARYLQPSEIAALDGRGPVLLPTRLPKWWTKTNQRVVAPPSGTDSIAVQWTDVDGSRTLPPGNGAQQALVNVFRGAYDSAYTPTTYRTINGAQRDYLTPWTQGICPQLDEGNADAPSVWWNDGTYIHQLTLLPQPGCSGGFNRLSDAVAIADSLVSCAVTNGRLTCTPPTS